MPDETGEPASWKTRRGSASAGVVALRELVIQFVVAEFRFAIRFTRNDDLMVELSLDLAVQYLQVVIRHHFQILRERIVRGQPQLVRHFFANP